MRNVVAVSILTLSFAISAFAQQPSAATPSTTSTAPVPAVAASDAVADQLAHRSIDMQAGPAWDKARFVSFTFDLERAGAAGVSFPQSWDRVTGNYRVSGKDQNGDSFLVIMNVNTKKGRGWKNGNEVSDSAAMLDMAYRRFTNDTFWLLMPLKMLDPGVRRESLGERTDSCGHTWDIVKVTSDPAAANATEDQYFAWVNRDTGLVDEWDMKLAGSKEMTPVEVMFHDFKRVGGVLISTRREVRGKGQIVKLNDVQISGEVPKGAFDK